MTFKSYLAFPPAHNKGQMVGNFNCDGYFVQLLALINLLVATFLFSHDFVKLPLELV